MVMGVAGIRSKPWSFIFVLHETKAVSILNSLFNSKRAQAWRRFANTIGATYQERSLLEKDRVCLSYKHWKIVMDKYEVGDGENNEVYTRLRTQYVSIDEFHFRIRSKSFVGRIAVFLGMSDINIEQPKFDRAFRVQSNDALKVKEFLSDAHLRKLLYSPNAIGFSITDLANTEKRVFLSEVAQLNYLQAKVVMDELELHRLFELMKLSLDRLVLLNIAYDADPDSRTKNV